MLMDLQGEIAALMALSENKKPPVSHRVMSCFPFVVGLFLAVASAIAITTED
jgi:hypothetical protein